MDDEFSLFPKLNPPPPAENTRDPKQALSKELRRKKKEKKRDLPGKEFASESENVLEEETEQKQLGKVLDITV